MSKEEFMKIQTCVLKVNIHCDGCKNKVKKIMQKIDGVFKTTIDAEQGKVTVLGNVDHNVLIKKLQKAGKHAELWGAQKPNNINQNQLTNQFKNMQLDNGKGGNNNSNNKGQKGGNNNPPKGGGGGGGGGQPNQQQAQQMKGIQDLKLHPFKDMKMPMDQNQKGVKFILPEDEDLSDYDDDEFDEDEFDDEYDDEFDEPLPAMKMPVMGNGLQGIPNNIMEMMNRSNPQLMNAQKLPQNGAAQNGKKGGGGGAIPVQVNIGNGESKNGNGGKKSGAGGGGGNNGGNNQNPGGKHGKNGGGFPQNGNNGGGANGKNGNNGGGGNSNNMNGNGGKKGNGGGGGGGGGGGMGGMSDGFRNMGGAVPPVMMANAKMGQMGNMPMGQMGNMPMGQMGNMPTGQMGNMPTGQMGNPPAVQGLPAATMGGGGSAGGSGGYFQGAGPDLMPGNPYHQQSQYMAALMNQQRAMGNERFQPMMYARPPPAVNFVPQQPYPPQQPYSPYPYPGPYPYPSHDPSYTHFFSDENTSSCTVM